MAEAFTPARILHCRICFKPALSCTSLHCAASNRTTANVSIQHQTEALKWSRFLDKLHPFPGIIFIMRLPTNSFKNSSVFQNSAYYIRVSHLFKHSRNAWKHTSNFHSEVFSHHAISCSKIPVNKFVGVEVSHAVCDLSCHLNHLLQSWRRLARVILSKIKEK